MKRIGFLAVAAVAMTTLTAQAQSPAGGVDPTTGAPYGAAGAPTSAPQQPQRRTPQMSRGNDRNRQNNNDSGLPELTVRAQSLNERLTQNVGNARWMRIIYRELNMLEEKNAPLYYPVTPMNGSMNLFTTIFQLVSDGKLPAYEYLDGYEAFDEEHLVDFKSVLDRFAIMYETVPNRDGTQRFVINESDVPSGEVKAFYVKEAWYFDQNNSVYDVKTLAISPIIFYEGDMGTERTPMFWVPYESVRPYVSNTYIMTSNINNAKTFTIDDYFRRRMFDGKIIKTENLLNIPLQAYCPTPDSLEHEQQKIENELISFNDSLWFKPDTTTAVADKKVKKSARKSTASVKSSKEKTTKTKTTKTKTEKSSATRSVRRRRS